MNPFKKILSIVLAAVNIFSAPAKLPEAQVKGTHPNPVETELDSDSSSEPSILSEAYNKYQNLIFTNSEICKNVDTKKLFSAMETAESALLDKYDNEDERDIEKIQTLEKIKDMTIALKCISEFEKNSIYYNEQHKQWEFKVTDPKHYKIQSNRYIQVSNAYIAFKYTDYMHDFVECIIPMLFKNSDVYLSIETYSDDMEKPMSETEQLLLEKGYVINGTDIPNPNAIVFAWIMGSSDDQNPTIQDDIQQDIIKQCNNITSDPNKIMDTSPHILASYCTLDHEFAPSLKGLINRIDNHDVYHELKQCLKTTNSNELITDEKKVQQAVKHLHDRTFGLHTPENGSEKGPER